MQSGLMTDVLSSINYSENGERNQFFFLIFILCINPIGVFILYGVMQQRTLATKWQHSHMDKWKWTKWN